MTVAAPARDERAERTSASLATSGLPTRDRPRGAGPIETLLDEKTDILAAVRGGLPPDLAERYGGDLAIPLRADRPTVVANFVETLDGVVALDDAGRTGGGEVSGFSPTDRFVMGLLRALADVVLVGAATVRASDRGRWTPRAVSPADAPAYADLRARLGLGPNPTTLIASATGRLDPGHPVFHDPSAPVVVAGPEAGLAPLRGALPDHVRFAAVPDGSAASGLVDVAVDLGARLVVTEGGPHLIGRLVADALVDELFLTLAPQLAGRDEGSPRLALLEGAALWPDSPRWLGLRSVRRAGDHLFLRYVAEEARP